jgi:all-trans-8'-apo-beta-carotenal 15,15'-oxygenase
VCETRRRLPGAAFGFFHDFCITDNYYVLLENPLRLDLWKLLTRYALGRACIAECLAFDARRPLKVRAARTHACICRCAMNWQAPSLAM